MTTSKTNSLGMLRVLFGEKWPAENYDKSLYMQAVSALQMVYLIDVHCFFGVQGAQIKLFNPIFPHISDKEIACVASKLRAAWMSGSTNGRRDRHTLPNDAELAKKFGILACKIPSISPDAVNAVNGVPANDFDVVVATYKRKSAWGSAPAVDKAAPFSSEEIGFVQEVATSILPMFHEVVRQRMRRFSAFPNEISARYLQDAHACDGAKEKLCAPWERGTPNRTATLSFDLRKSTVCMEQADSPKAFAEFLSLMTNVLTRITHQHGGVFDKFTGDGCLVHFLEAEQHFFNEATGNGKVNLVTGDAMIVNAALECAIDMQLASRWLLGKLRPNLRLDSKLYGAGIGIDISDTFWDVDRSSNPVVVGRGVVGACRLGSLAKKNEIYVTNVAYYCLPSEEQRRFGKASITGKNMHADEKFEAWRYRPGTNADMLSRQQEIDRTCDEVMKRGYVGF